MDKHKLKSMEQKNIKIRNITHERMCIKCFPLKLSEKEVKSQPKKFTENLKF